MDDLAMPAATDFVLPKPPPGFDSWAATPYAEACDAHRAGTPTVYVEFCTGATRPYVTYNFVAQKDS